MVTPEKEHDDISPYEYINPVGLDMSTSSMSSDSAVRMSTELNGQKEIESQYITVNTSPPPGPNNAQHVCYI